MLRLAVPLLAWLATTAPAIAADPPAYAILLDASGSMGGFAKDAGWRSLLSRLESSATQKWEFGDTAHRVAGNLADVRLTRRDTMLDVALKAWVENSGPHDVVVMVTDNVADEGSTASRDAQAAFYALLNPTKGMARQISAITLIPSLLPFSGTIWEPGKGGKGTVYSGNRRALAFYLLAREGVASDAMKRLTLHMADLLQDAGLSYEILDISPFKGMAVKPALNLRGIESDNTRITYNGEPGAILNVEGLTTGTPLHLQMVANVVPGRDFELRDAAVEASISLEGHELITSAQVVRASVTPRQTTLKPEQGQDFDITFESKAIEFLSHVPLSQQIELALTNKTEINGKIIITYKILRQNLYLANALAAKWSYDGPVAALGTPNPTVQTKLYRLQDLVRGMVPEDQLSRSFIQIPVRLVLRFSPVPVLILLAAGLLLAIPIGWLIYRSLRPRDFVVTPDEGGDTSLSLGLFQADDAYNGDKQCAVSVRNLGLGLLVGARGGRVIGSRLLGPGGDTVDVMVAGDDGDNVPCRFNIRSVAMNAAGDKDDWGLE